MSKTPKNKKGSKEPKQPKESTKDSTEAETPNSTLFKRNLAAAAQPESVSYGRSVPGKPVKTKSFTQTVKVYVPKTPRGSETPQDTQSLSNNSFVSDPGVPELDSFPSPAVFKQTNLTALRKPWKQMTPKYKKIYKSIDLNKTREEAKGDEGPTSLERSTIGHTTGLRQTEEDEEMRRSRHSLPVETCPPEIGGRETMGSQGGKYEFKEESVDENDVIRLENREETGEGKSQRSKEEGDILYSPLESPGRGKRVEDEDEVKVEEDEGKEEVMESVRESNLEEEQEQEQEQEQGQGQGDTGEIEREQREEELNVITEEKETQEDEIEQGKEKEEVGENKEKETEEKLEEVMVKGSENNRAEAEISPKSENVGLSSQDASVNLHDNSISQDERNVRDREVSGATSTNETTSVSQRDGDVQETPKARLGADLEIQGSGNQFKERENVGVEVERRREEAPKKRAFVSPTKKVDQEKKDHLKPEAEKVEAEEIKENVELAKDVDNDKSKPVVPNLDISKSKSKERKVNLEINTEEEQLRLSERKKFAQNLADKLEKVQDEGNYERGKKREGCCQAGCNTF